MIFFKLLSYLPFSVLYILSDMLAFTAHRIIRYRKEVVLMNLKNSFPEASEKEVRKMAKDFYRNLSDIVVETMKALTMSPETLKKRVQYKNIEIVQAYYEKQQSIMVLATHTGNWEWMLLSGCLHLPYPIDGVYAPLANPFFQKVMYKLRSRFGSLPIPRGEILKELSKRSKMLRAVGMVADQSPVKQAEKHWTKFLNQDTAFLKGADMLAKMTKYPVVFLGLHRVKRGYYEVSIEKIAEPPYEKNSTQILDAYIQKSEQLIRKNPSAWLWSHRRWKLKKSIYA